MRDIFIFLAALGLFFFHAAIPAKAQFTPDKIPVLIDDSEEFEQVFLYNVQIDAQSESAGVQGVQIDLQLQQLALTSLIGDGYSLCIQFKDAEGRPLRAGFPNTVYADDKGRVALRKRFRMTKYTSLFSGETNYTCRIQDLDRELTKMVDATNTGDGGAGEEVIYDLQHFLPYYVLGLEAGQHELTAHFYIYEDRFRMGDSTKVKAYKPVRGIKTHKLVVPMPKLKDVKLSVDELEVDASRGAWDPDPFDQGYERPDPAWRISMATEHMDDVIFTSNMMENSLFGKWHHVYSPPFKIVEGDILRVSILDMDDYTSNDAVGIWQGTFREILEFAKQRKEIGFGLVKRMIFNSPLSEVRLKLLRLDLDQGHTYDPHSYFYEVEAPDLLVKVFDNNGEMIYETQGTENDYSLIFEDAEWAFRPDPSLYLNVEVYDKDYIMNDRISTIHIPFGEVLRHADPTVGGKMRFQEEGVADLLIQVE